MNKVKTNPPEMVETINIFLDPIKHPVAFNTKVKELVENGISEAEARSFLMKVPFQMELYYSKDQGLFMIESEALESITAYNPYDGKQLIPAE